MAESFVEQRKRELGITAPTNIAVAPSPTPKDSDFVIKRKMDLGIIPDTRTKNLAPTRQDIQKFGAPTLNPANLPLVKEANQFVKDIKPKWNSLKDNPITNTLAKGGMKALDYALVKPGESIAAGVSDLAGAINNKIAPKKTAMDGSPILPSENRSLKKDLHDIWTDTPMDHSPLEGAAPNDFIKKLPGTGVTLGDIENFGLQSIAPGKLVSTPFSIAKYAGTNLGKALGETMSKAAIVAKDAEKVTRGPIKLKVMGQQEQFTKTMDKVIPVAKERMVPPLENENELAKWVQSHLNEAGHNVSLNEVRKMGYEDLRQYSEIIHPSVEKTVKKVSNEMGYGKILDETNPTIKQSMEKFASERAYGFPAPKVPISRELKNIKGPKIPNVEAPVEEAAKMKGNWFTNLFGEQGVGISAFNSSKRISKDPLTTEQQIVKNGLKNDTQGIKDTIAAKAREVYQNHVDQLSPLKKINSDTYESAMDSARANNITNTIIRDKFVTPEGNVVGSGLGEIFKKVARGNDKQFIDYLTLRHAATRMERGEQVYADSLKMTTDKVKERMGTLEKRYPGFSDIAKEWDGFNNNVLQHYGVNEGLISDASYNALRKKNPNYTPMNRQFKRSEKPGRKFLQKTSNSSFSGQKAPIKEVSKVGSARFIVDPRKSTIENVGAWVNASMRNRSMQSMADAIKRNPEAFKGVAEIVQKPKGGADLNKVLMDGGTDDFVESLNQDFANLFKKSNVDGENVVRAMIKGEPVYIKVHDPEIVKTLIGMGPQASNILIDTLGFFSDATKRGATGLLSPVFAVKGATMDLVQSAIQAKNPAMQAAYTIYAIFSGIGDRLNIPGLKNMAEEFRRSGGEYSAALKGDRKLNKSVSSLKRDPLLAPQNIAKGAWNAVKSPFKVLSEVGNIAENAPRIAASRLELNRLGGKRTPGNVRQAMSAGREATVNFSRKGAMSRDLEAAIPYNNAAIQGTIRIFKGIKNNPIRTVAAVGTLAVLPKLYEYVHFHNDPEYQNLPARERMRFLIVNKNKDGSFTKIPMDPAYNSIGEMTIEALRHFKDQDPIAFKGATDALANAWLPPAVTGALQGVTQGTGVMGSIEGAANATVAAPAIATIANKSFTGAPIESAAVTDRSPKNRYDEKTSGIAKWLGEQTGFSPMKADYIMRAYGGDLVRLGAPLTSDVGAGNIRNTLLKNFIVDPAFTNTLTNDYYSAKEKMTQAYHDNDEVNSPLPKWFDQNLYRRITSTAAGSITKKLSILSNDKKDIVMDKTLKSAEKASKLREVQEEINKIYLDINSELKNSKVPMS